MTTAFSPSTRLVLTSLPVTPLTPVCDVFSGEAPQWFRIEPVHVYDVPEWLCTQIHCFITLAPHGGYAWAIEVTDGVPHRDDGLPSTVFETDGESPSLEQAQWEAWVSFRRRFLTLEHHLVIEEERWARAEAEAIDWDSYDGLTPETEEEE